MMNKLLGCAVSCLVLAQAVWADEPVTLTLLVPGDAQVEFGGEKTTSSGAVRTFTSPPVPAGKEFNYDVVVTLKDKTVRRKITFQAGGTNTYDFRNDFAGVAAAVPRNNDEFKKIAEEAFIYGFPMVMNYGTLYEYFINAKSPEFKAGFNQIYNTARVYTPQDTTVVTPNSDTPYSFVCMDLRQEPFVLCLPEIETARYFSVQLIDLYTFNYGYMGSRTTGNAGGCFMIAGPSWKGEKPEGITKVFRCETDFSIGLVRTQLFSPSDIENVKRIQAGYQGQPLSTFLKQASPQSIPVTWPQLDKQLAESNPFSYLNFVLQFCPTTGPADVEKALRERFAKIGVEAGKPFPLDRLTAEQKADLGKAMKNGVESIKKYVETFGANVNGWRISTSAFGDRAFMNGNWLKRAGAAMAGIYGNDAVEALYPMLATDDKGEKPDCSKHDYTLTFAAGQLPPVNAFWSVTMYDGKTQLLIKNPIDRYLINSPMLPDLKKNNDGSLTLYIQKEAPAKGEASNWLPAPNGPIYLVMRLYWPKDEALNGTWKPPVVKQAR